MIKRILCSFILCLSAFSYQANGEVLFDSQYKFAKHRDFESYQQYVGKTVIYAPSEETLHNSTIEKEMQGYGIVGMKPGVEYVIKSISPSSGIIKTDDKVVIKFKEKNGKLKAVMKRNAYLIHHSPLIFVDDYNTDRKKIIGRKYADPQVKGAYVVDDVKLVNKSGDFEVLNFIRYYVSNPEIGRRFTTGDVDQTVREYLLEDKAALYQSYLKEVEKPKNPTQRYGEIKKIDEDSLNRYSFEDENIKIAIFGGESRFVFSLSNKTANTIKIIWDDAVFVQTNGVTSKVIHSGIKYSERENNQTPSIIIRGATLEDFALPTSLVRNDGLSWVEESMFPSEVSYTVKQIRLMLPIQIEDVVNEYVFIFNVKYKAKHPERLRQ